MQRRGCFFLFVFSFRCEKFAWQRETESLTFISCLWFHVNAWWHNVLYTRGRQRPSIDGQALCAADYMINDLRSYFMMSGWEIAATLFWSVSGKWWGSAGYTLNTGPKKTAASYVPAALSVGYCGINPFLSLVTLYVISYFHLRAEKINSTWRVFVVTASPRSWCAAT